VLAAAGPGATHRVSRTARLKQTRYVNKRACTNLCTFAVHCPADSQPPAGRQCARGVAMWAGRIGKWSARRQAERRMLLRPKVSIPPSAIFDPSTFEKAVPRPADAKMAEIAEQMRKISGEARSRPPRRAWPWPQ
jgi:hypothetical protein